MRQVVGLVGLLGAGCILPVSTGAPMPATTVGKGRIGGAMSAEAPVLNLIAEDPDGNSDPDNAISYGAAPAAAFNFTLSYGLTDSTDLEVTGEGSLYFFIIPLPTGGSIGIRQHFDASDEIDFALAARIGHVGTGDSDDTEGASANYAQVQGVIQLKHGGMRPLLALNLMPANIKRTFSSEPDYSFNGFASSLTFGLMFTGDKVTAGPYIVGTNFYSDRFDNVGWFVGGGLMFASRPDRTLKPAPPPPYAPPAPGYGPQPGYPNAPGGTPGYPNAPQPYAPPPPPVQTPQ